MTLRHLTCVVDKSKDAALAGIEEHTHECPAKYNLLETMVLEGMK